MDFNKYIELALAIHAAASIIVSLTPTPSDDKIVGKLYKVIETLALVVGKAKQRWSIGQHLRPEDNTTLFFYPISCFICVFPR